MLCRANPYHVVVMESGKHPLQRCCGSAPKKALSAVGHQVTKSNFWPVFLKKQSFIAWAWPDRQSSNRNSGKGCPAERTSLNQTSQYLHTCWQISNRLCTKCHYLLLASLSAKRSVYLYQCLPHPLITSQLQPDPDTMDREAKRWAALVRHRTAETR